MGTVHGDVVHQGTAAVGLRICSRDFMNQRGTRQSNLHRPFMNEWPVWGVGTRR
jgi:hypothetical protein